MAAGKEIRRLRGKITAATVADLIGVKVDRMRKWEERDTDPVDTGDIQKVEDYFGVPLNQLDTIETFEFVKKSSTQRKNPSQPDQDYKDKYITLLEEQIKEKEKLIQLLTKRLDDIEDGLVTTASVQQAWQEFWTEHIPLKKKMTLVEIKGIIRNKAFDKQQAFAKDGIQIV